MPRWYGLDRIEEEQKSVEQPYTAKSGSFEENYEYVVTCSDVVHGDVAGLLDRVGERRESLVYLPHASSWIVLVKMSEQTAAKCRQIGISVRTYRKEI
jgi:hypothetical protein